MIRSAHHYHYIALFSCFIKSLVHLFISHQDTNRIYTIRYSHVTEFSQKAHSPLTVSGFWPPLVKESRSRSAEKYFCE